MKLAICDDNEPHEIDEFSSGEELLENFEKGKYDVAILDMYMKKLKELHENNLHIFRHIANKALDIVISHINLLTFLKIIVQYVKELNALKKSLINNKEIVIKFIGGL